MLSWAAIIVLFVLVIKARTRIEELERKAQELGDALGRLKTRLQEQRAASPAAPTVAAPEPTRPTPSPVSSPAYTYPAVTRPPVPVAPAALTEIEPAISGAEARAEPVPVAAL